MKPKITYQDFDKIDIRIGTVIACTNPEWSKKLIRLEVDFGATIGKRVIFSGIKQWYVPDTLLGGQFPFLINLEPKMMGNPSAGSGQGEESQGMMLMADGEEKPVLFYLKEDVTSGSSVR